MRVKTIKRLVILVAMLGLIGGACFIGRQQQVTRLARAVRADAELAEKNGDYAKAENLYGQLEAIFPDNVDMQIKYADVHRKVAKTFSRQQDSLGIYATILKKDPSRDDVRRRLMELKMEMNRFEDAQTDLSILLQTVPKNENDEQAFKEYGELAFQMGRCYEAALDEAKAVEFYRKALQYHAPQPIEVYQRLALLLRSDRLKQENEADQAIADMVQSALQNYKVYLARGRYRASHPDLSKRAELRASAKADFQKARTLAPDEPEIYLELAKTAEDETEGETGLKAAQEILRDGLKAAPASARLYEALANNQMRDNQMDKAVKTLELGLKNSSNDPEGRLHWVLAGVLAHRREAGKLLVQIEELKKINYPQPLVQYLNAHYYIIIGNYVTARQILGPLQSVFRAQPPLKARVNDLLAKCYSQAVEPEMVRQAYLRASSANPNDVSARLGLIDCMVREGEIEAAIKEYRTLLKKAPQVRIPLAQLLIQRNRQRPAAQRDWTEVENLINEATKETPESIEPVVVRAELRVAQGDFARAREEIEAAKTGLPKNSALRVTLAEVVGLSGRIDEALGLVEQAEQELGDQVDFRLVRAKLLSLDPTKRGPKLIAALKDLSEKADSFSNEDRRRLLHGLATELIRQQDNAEACRLWARLVEQDPNNLELRATLLDLLFETANQEEIEKNIEQISKIEGTDDALGRYCKVRYLIWQAQRATDASKRATFRTEARVLLNDLKSRRGDWSVIPLALAQLEEQELAEGGLTKDERREKEHNVTTYCLHAVRLGQRKPDFVRQTVKLLFQNNRGAEALELLNMMPNASQLGEVGHQASQFAIENGDFERAAEIARKAIAANPGGFQDRLWLVQVLHSSGNLSGAEAELQKAVDFAKNDPDRWIALVTFMVLTKQPDKAEKAIADAEQNVPKADAPLTLARCCELMGRTYEAASEEDKAKKWYGETEKWYQKAQAAQPDDFTVMRRLVEFYLRTKQMAEARSQLTAIRNRGPQSKPAGIYAWANRTLALTYVSSNSVDLMKKALALFEPNERNAPPGREGEALDDAEDKRILARVLDAQRSNVQLKRAIALLESLIDKSLATNEDRFLLATLHEKRGDWAKAKEGYRELNLRTKNARDLETLTRRPAYLAQFADSLLGKHQGTQELAEVQDLIDDIKQLQPQGITWLALQVELDRARNEPDQAAKIIKEYAARPNVTATALEILARLAEKQKEVKLAEEVYRQRAQLPTATRGGVLLATFLGRQQQVKEGLDVLEPLWTDTREPEALAAACIEVLYAVEHPDPAQLDRVSRWFERELAKTTARHPRAKPILLVGLGNVREKQGSYQDAKDLYTRAITEGDLDGTSRNNLAWLIALKDRDGRAALKYINQAIELGGPKGDYFDTRGIAHLCNGNTQLAIDDLKRAVELGPSPAKYFHLAQAYFEIKDKQKAKENLEKARAMGLAQRDLHALEVPAYDKLVIGLKSP